MKWGRARLGPRYENVGAAHQPRDPGEQRGHRRLELNVELGRTPGEPGGCRRSDQRTSACAPFRRLPRAHFVAVAVSGDGATVGSPPCRARPDSLRLPSLPLQPPPIATRPRPRAVGATGVAVAHTRCASGEPGTLVGTARGACAPPLRISRSPHPKPAGPVAPTSAPSRRPSRSRSIAAASPANKASLPRPGRRTGPPPARRSRNHPPPRVPDTRHPPHYHSPARSDRRRPRARRPERRRKCGTSSSSRWGGARAQGRRREVRRPREEGVQEGVRREGLVPRDVDHSPLCK